MHVTTLLLLAFIILSFILSIVLDAIAKNFSLVSIATYLFGFLVYFLLILDQNCVAEGPCTTWGWVKVMISIFIFLLLIATKIYTIVAVRKEQKQKKEDATAST